MPDLTALDDFSADLPGDPPRRRSTATIKDREFRERRDRVLDMIQMLDTFRNLGLSEARLLRLNLDGQIRLDREYEEHARQLKLQLAEECRALAELIEAHVPRQPIPVPTKQE
jgi:hypothetical protein